MLGREMKPWRNLDSMLFSRYSKWVYSLKHRQINRYRDTPYSARALALYRRHFTGTHGATL